MFVKKISLTAAVLLALLGILLSAFITYTIVNPVEEITNSVASSDVNCSPKLTRLKGYSYIRPLLFADNDAPSKLLMPVKNEVESVISNYKQSGTIESASVYLRELNEAEWISMGSSEKYFPGSLLKVPELITYCKMKEKNPGLFNKKIAYNTAFILPKQGYFLSRSIEVGKSYTVKELLHYMIAYSDNNATILLTQQMDLEIFKKVFTDMGMETPDLTGKDIPITAKDYSLFMRSLYNSTYISNNDSEFCLELLGKSDFATGMRNGLPKETFVAHKFGEAGDSTLAHFSESGIIYKNNSPYLLTVMTKGKDNKLLPSVISDISKRVFALLSSS